MPNSNLLTDEDGVLVTEYAAKQKYIRWTEVVMNPCDRSVVLRSQHLLIHQIQGFSVNKRTYAYVISGNCGQLAKGKWLSAACDTSILLMDTTGNGTFDYMHFGAPFPEKPPAWTLK